MLSPRKSNYFPVKCRPHVGNHETGVTGRSETIRIYLKWSEKKWNYSNSLKINLFEIIREEVELSEYLFKINLFKIIGEKVKPFEFIRRRNYSNLFKIITQINVFSPVE